MDLRQYTHAVTRYWWVIALPTVLGLGLGILATTGAPPQYQASVTFFVTTSSEPTASAAVQGDEFAQRRVNSYLELLGTDRFASMVAAAAVDVDLTADQVEGMIGAKGDIDTVLFTATVTSGSRALALSVAGAVATEFVDLVRDVETTGDTPPSVNLEVVDGPTVVELPKRPLFSLAWRAALGGVFGLGIALLLELRDQTLRTEDDLIAIGAAPVLGNIPFDRQVDTAALLVEASRHSNFAEAFRQFRTNLQFVDVEHRVQVLVVTSSVPGEGKSVTSSNLALSLAAAGRQVLLVEADLRLPRISGYFGIDRSVGLTDVLIGRAELDEVLRPIAGHSLTVLPSGHAPPNPSELLGSESMRTVLAELRTRYDVIVVDTPPLLPVADGAVASAWADGVVLLVRTAKTPSHQVELSLRSLSSVGARLVGAVMTMTPSGTSSRYTSYDYRAGDGPRPDRTARAELAGPGSVPDRAGASTRTPKGARPSGRPATTPPSPVERLKAPLGSDTEVDTPRTSASPRSGSEVVSAPKEDGPEVPVSVAAPLPPPPPPPGAPKTASTGTRSGNRRASGQTRAALSRRNTTSGDAPSRGQGAPPAEPVPAAAEPAPSPTSRDAGGSGAAPAADGRGEPRQ